MAIRNIVKDGDPVLEKKCRKVEKFDNKLHVLLDDMHETMELANGVGLAAPQVGILRRIVVIDIGDGPIEMINPEITFEDGEQEGYEGCLSFPGEWGIVKRPMKVKAKAQDRDGNWYGIEGEELLARAICHELDHLSGITFNKIASKMLTPDEIEEMMHSEEDAESEEDV